MQNKNELNSLIKRQNSGMEKINNNKKQEQTICFLQETHFGFKDTHRFKVKKQKNIFHAKRNQKRAGIAALVLK